MRIIAIAFLGIAAGVGVTHYLDRATIVEARQNEAQANGLEDECKAQLTPVRTVFNEEPNGDYRVLLYGQNRALVCEEQDIKVIQQGDAVKPLVLECRHDPYMREQ